MRHGMGPYLLQFNLMGVHPGHTAKSLLFLKTQGKSENFFTGEKLSPVFCLQKLPSVCMEFTFC